MLKLFNDDCIKIMENMESKSVTCTITDIPYDGVNRKSNGLRNLDKGNADILTFDLDMFLNEVLRITNGSIYIFCGHNQVSEIYKKFAEEGLSTRVIVWEKTNPSPMNGQHVWLNGVELCVYAKFKNATFNEHCKNTVFRFPTVRNKNHPTPKPVKLLEKFVEVSTNEGDTVFDPCMGSGSTGVACISLNRNFIGVELDKNYFEKTKQILEGLNGNT